MRKRASPEPEAPPAAAGRIPANRGGGGDGSATLFASGALDFAAAPHAPGRSHSATHTPRAALAVPPSALLRRAARWWARREIRRSLDGLQVAGLREARAAACEEPTIFAATHVAFWDVFLLLALDEALGTDGYALMDAENVCRVPLFRRLGGIPVRRDRPRAGLRAAAALLDRPGRALWIFPQGSHRPPHLRPLGFRPGVALLARMAPAAAVVPVALQYAYAAKPGPRAYACFGERLPSARLAAAGGLAVLERCAEVAGERIDAHLTGRGEGFEVLVGEGSGPLPPP